MNLEILLIYSSLGYGASYEEIVLYLNDVSNTSSYVEQLKNLAEDALVQFIFDNADWNRWNDTGKNSWHVMGGIAVVSPRCTIDESYEVYRCNKIISSNKEQFIPITEPPNQKLAFTENKNQTVTINLFVT